MDFDRLVERLEGRLKEPLPGPLAHEKMRAVPVGNLIPKFAHKTPPRPGGVLIVLYPDQGKILFPLIKRPDYDGLHSGQISFPGGKTEPGEDRITTALREGYEEIGIEQRDIKVLGTLSDFFVIPSNFMVTPVVAFSSQRPLLRADPVEVARILHGDVQALLPEESIRQKEITAARSYQMMAPHFEIENEIVWGATAMILNEFRTVIKDVIN